ncbi:MAG: glutamine amidotransferase [Bacteroidales bacterium]
MAKIYYVGDWAVMTGPVFAESPFNYDHKGLEIFNYGTWLKQALESSGEHTVESVPSWDFYKLPPGAWEKILQDYDIFIFSDVEARLFQLEPNFFDRSKFGTRVLTFPDRIRLTIESVNSGKRILWCGGWLSFTGEIGKGGWGRTGLKEILPVKCLDYEDLVESTEGFLAEPAKGSNAFSPLDFSNFPPIMGYNKTIPRESFDVLLKVKETGDPLVAWGKLGKGRVLAYMSDPAPHWGCNFVYWEQYNNFWLACIDLLLH